MTNTNSDSKPNSTGQRGSKAKKASVASVGVTVLLVIGYLIASWLGIPLDGLTSTGPNSQTTQERPVAVATDGQATADAPVSATSAFQETKTQAATSYKIENVTVRDLNGKVAFRGTVDLTATMRRIDAGQQLERFRNDGSTFQNRERRLPTKERGHYKEYVHPTPKLGGPGPQRVVTGRDGEAYYTFDHYRSFQKIR